MEECRPTASDEGETLEPQAYMVTQGEGFPIVFAHGMGVDHRSLMMLDRYFPERTQRIYLDLPGYGRTPALDGPGGLPEYVDWFCGAIDDILGPRAPFAVVETDRKSVV